MVERIAKVRRIELKMPCFRSESMKISTVIPCYNEANRLDLMAFERFVQRTIRAHLLFVDDGSTDQTADLLRDFCRAHPKSATLLVLPENQGKAEAVRRGILAASESSCDAIGFWDADLATPLEAVDQFRSTLERRPAIQIIWGTRFPLLGRRIQRQRIRRLLGRAFSNGAAIAVGIPIHDALCGAKMFRNGNLCKQLFSKPFDSRWIFDVEILARLRSIASADDGNRIGQLLFEQVLDDWQEIGDSRLRTRDFVRAGFELSRLMWQFRIRGAAWRPDDRWRPNLLPEHGPAPNSVVNPVVSLEQKDLGRHAA
jgi:glycosyltransferase involved in cell wall biosynthesis